MSTKTKIHFIILLLTATIGGFFVVKMVLMAAPPVQSHKTIILIDTSGSMAGPTSNPLIKPNVVRAREKAEELIDQIDALDQGGSEQLAGLFDFSIIAQIKKSLQKNFSQTKQETARIWSGTEKTDLGEGLREAVNEIVKGDQALSLTIILFTDGLVNQGDSESDMLNGIVNQAKAQDIKINVYGVGVDPSFVNEDFLQNISDATGGTYTFLGP